MKSLYEQAFSYITSQIDKKISGLNDEKSALEDAKNAAVEALEAERDARLEVIETQKKQLQEQEKLIDKQIDGLKDEIDAINDAADARQREINLQKALYELERMQNQRTRYIYQEGNDGAIGQMLYVADTAGKICRNI